MTLKNKTSVQLYLLCGSRFWFKTTGAMENLHPAYTKEGALSLFYKPDIPLISLGLLGNSVELAISSVQLNPREDFGMNIPQ